PGAHTIAHHLVGRVDNVPSVATTWRILSRRGLIRPEPHKRPGCSFKRFEAQLPNETWQADSTHWQLADDTDIEILKLIDDHSRLVLASVALPSLKTPTSTRSSVRPLRPKAYRRACCATTRLSSAAVRGVARSSSRPSWNASASVASTPARTTPDLRQGRALPPDHEALPGQTNPPGFAGSPAAPARHLS